MTQFNRQARVHQRILVVMLVAILSGCGGTAGGARGDEAPSSSQPLSMAAKCARDVTEAVGDVLPRAAEISADQADSELQLQLGRNSDEYPIALGILYYGDTAKALRGEGIDAAMKLLPSEVEGSCNRKYEDAE